METLAAKIPKPLADEVDRLIWLPPIAARHRLTHDRDRPLVDALLRTVTG